MRFTSLVLATIIGGLAVLPASAQEPLFGVQGALSFPGGDLSDTAGLGLQFGGNARWAFGGGHGLMGRVDYTYYGQKNDINTSSLAVAADYTFHLDRTRHAGTYLLAGLNMMNYDLGYPDGTTNHNTLGLDLGLGYDVDAHLGYQLRMTTNSFNSQTMSALNLGITYSF